MSNFVPGKHHIREVLLHYFILKKTPAETHRLLVEAYSEHAPSTRMCERWFQQFKEGNFNVHDKEHGKPCKKFDDAKLKALLIEDSSKTQKQLAEILKVDQATVSRRLHMLGMKQVEGRWISALTDATKHNDIMPIKKRRS